VSAGATCAEGSAARGKRCRGDSRKWGGGTIGVTAAAARGRETRGPGTAAGEGGHRLENFRPCLTLRGTALGIEKRGGQGPLIDSILHSVRACVCVCVCTLPGVYACVCTLPGPRACACVRVPLNSRRVNVKYQHTLLYARLIIHAHVYNNNIRVCVCEPVQVYT